METKKTDNMYGYLTDSQIVEWLERRAEGLREAEPNAPRRCDRRKYARQAERFERAAALAARGLAPRSPIPAS